ncbi:hypothetical protein BLA18112_00524 [Burkholderia lata]|uniref:Uncharacterized protein n=1 Tax=Burkholderia lata (strain ATCC 17760 / DSM 23089 / LMG 22485 / NCIMB 9086 / R18194 / 383) TaxID=482957 RepID=A0A6P2TM72_BURL3|nr:hypothetical protein [Burkholderia lata]VWC57528.1 hypothetical protein BLA18112_00524 [Burkholderia lata]
MVRRKIARLLGGFGKSLAGLLIVFSLSSVSYATGEGYGTQAFSDLFPLLGQLSDQNHPVDDQLKLSIDRVSNAFTRIEQELNARQNPPPPALAASIAAYRAPLQEALSATTPGDAAARLNDVDRDAELKWRYMVDSSGFSAFDHPLLVDVSVVTMRGDKEEPGYWVTCNPFRDSTRKDALFPFASETNHASLSLPPGHYRLQIYRGPQLILGRDIMVGQDATQSQKVVIDVAPYR